MRHRLGDIHAYCPFLASGIFMDKINVPFSPEKNIIFLDNCLFLKLDHGKLSQGGLGTRWYRTVSRIPLDDHV